METLVDDNAEDANITPLGSVTHLGDLIRKGIRDLAPFHSEAFVFRPTTGRIRGGMGQTKDTAAAGLMSPMVSGNLSLKKNLTTNGTSTSGCLFKFSSLSNDLFISQVLASLNDISDALNMEQACFEYRKQLKQSELKDVMKSGGQLEALVLDDYRSEVMPDGLPALLLRDVLIRTKGGNKASLTSTHTRIILMNDEIALAQ